VTETTQPQQEPGALGKLMIDLGPLVVFFAVNAWAGIMEATIAFMAAITAAMIVSRVRYGKISPLLWFSGVMVLVLGGITVWLHDETFIKITPTVYYLFVSALLGFGLATGRNLMKMVLGTVYPGLSDRGWRLLTRNWIGFFVAMALLNEIVWRTTSTDFWVGFKLWGVLPATFLFVFANVPMLLRHGLQLEQAEKDPPAPPSQ